MPFHNFLCVLCHFLRRAFIHLKYSVRSKDWENSSRTSRMGGGGKNRDLWKTTGNMEQRERERKKKNLINLLFPRKSFSHSPLSWYYHERVPMGLKVQPVLHIVNVQYFHFASVHLVGKTNNNFSVLFLMRTDVAPSVRSHGQVFLVVRFSFWVFPRRISLAHFRTSLYWKIFKSNRCSNEIWLCVIWKHLNLFRESSIQP